MGLVRRCFNLGVVLAGLTTGLSGQESPAPKPLVMTAENLMAGDERHRDRPGAILPGDIIRYRIRFTNLRADSIRNVQFTDPIPAGLHYVAGSAGADREDAFVEFSIDGGASWSDAPTIEETVAGRPVRRPAPPERYTNVRWSLRGWVKPSAQVTAELKVQLSPGATTP